MFTDGILGHCKHAITGLNLMTVELAHPSRVCHSVRVRLLFYCAHICSIFRWLDYRYFVVIWTWSIVEYFFAKIDWQFCHWNAKDDCFMPISVVLYCILYYTTQICMYLHWTNRAKTGISLHHFHHHHYSLSSTLLFPRARAKLFYFVHIDMQTPGQDWISKDNSPLFVAVFVLMARSPLPLLWQAWDQCYSS